MANDDGVLMSGLGRLLVYSGIRAWIGMRFELPRLLEGITLQPGARCLDLGAGLGWGSAGLVRRDPSLRVVAVDYDPAVLVRTRDYVRGTGARDVPACRADGKRLPFRDRTFDLVICLYALHHFRGYAEGLREIRRVMKPGATFALIDPIRREGRSSGRGHHGMHVPTRDELEGMLKDAGFGIDRLALSMGRARGVMRLNAA
jgi:ubiquinone/menaquinone biosynthesis C-methylase UbiE